MKKILEKLTKAAFAEASAGRPQHIHAVGGLVITERGAILSTGDVYGTDQHDGWYRKATNGWRMVMIDVDSPVHPTNSKNWRSFDAPEKSVERIFSEEILDRPFDVEGDRPSSEQEAATKLVSETADEQEAARVAQQEENKREWRESGFGGLLPSQLLEWPMEESVGDPGLAENPKEAIGDSKPSTSVLPWPVLMQVGKKLGYGEIPALTAFGPRCLYLVALGLTEGALKYGRHNYRAAGRILARVYFDATGRHLDGLLAGQDIDPDSGLYHGIKAICSLMVLYDAIIKRTFNDDRPPHQRGYLFVEAEEFIGQESTVLTYIGEAKRSMAVWWEGGDKEHLIDAMVSLFRLCECYIDETLIDDRGHDDPDFLDDIKPMLDDINKRIPEEKRLPAWTQKRVQKNTD